MGFVRDLCKILAECQSDSCGILLGLQQIELILIKANSLRQANEFTKDLLMMDYGGRDDDDNVDNNEDEYDAYGEDNDDDERAHACACVGGGA